MHSISKQQWTQLEIFTYLNTLFYRWAKVQCAHNQLEPSPKNIRLVLKDILFFIRFPVMTSEDFCARVLPTNLLTEEEILELQDAMKIPRTQYRGHFISKRR